MTLSATGKERVFVWVGPERTSSKINTMAGCKRSTNTTAEPGSNKLQRGSAQDKVCAPPTASLFVSLRGTPSGASLSSKGRNTGPWLVNPVHKITNCTINMIYVVFVQLVGPLRQLGALGSGFFTLGRRAFCIGRRCCGWAWSSRRTGSLKLEYRLGDNLCRARSRSGGRGGCWYGACGCSRF